MGLFADDEFGRWWCQAQDTLRSADLASGEQVSAHFERADVCVVPAAGVIAEAMVCIVLAGAMLEKFGGDHLEETRRNYRAYLRTIGTRGGPAAPPREEETTEG